MRWVAFATILIAAFGCQKKAAPVPQVQETLAASDYRELAASSCQPCHTAIVAEWSQSMHGNSTVEKDPLFRFMLGQAKKAVGPKVDKGCRSCHDPFWDADAEKQLASAEGVTCVVCHEIAPTHPTALAGGEVARLDSERAKAGVQSLCLSCHDQRLTKAGVQICITGPENRSAGSPSCIDCHMASVVGSATQRKNSAAAGQHRTHAFPGGHDATMVANSAGLSMAVDAETSELVVTIKAAATGHSLPTGNPMRYLEVELVAIDESGADVWRNHQDNVFLEPRDAFVMRVFADDKGTRPVPPFASKGEPDDNRLTAGETRELRYKLPANAHKVTGRVLYHLAPDKVLMAAEVPESWLKAVVVSTAEVAL